MGCTGRGSKMVAIDVSDFDSTFRTNKVSQEIGCPTDLQQDELFELGEEENDGIFN